MVVCLFAARKSLLIDLINRTQFKLMKLTQKRYDLQVYGDAVNDGKITWEEMAKMPKCYRQRTNDFIFNCQNPTMGFAEADAERYINGMRQNNAMWAQRNPQFCMDETQMLEQEWAIRENVNKSYLEAEARKQQDMIFREEAKIDQETKKLDTRLKAYQQELDAVEKAEDKAIQQSIVKYGGDGR